MLKTLRKNNKWIMVIFGSMLMLTFLVDQGASGLNQDPAKRVIARSRDGKIRVAQVEKSERELRVLQMICPFTVRGSLGVEDGLHWMLLTDQAAKMGLVGDAQDGENWIPELCENEAFMSTLAELSRQYPPSFARQILNFQAEQISKQAAETAQQIVTQMPRLAGEAGVAPNDIPVALSKLRAVTRMSELYGASASFSDKQTIYQFRRESDATLARALVIPAEAVIDLVAEPAPERLEAHFQTYKALKAGGEGTVFGYMQPPKVRLEWFRLSRQVISDAIQISPIDLNKHWQQNREKYPGEFATVQATVEADLKRSKIESVMSSAARVMKDRVRASISRLPVDGPYRRLPETWDVDGPKLEQLAQEVAQTVKTSTGIVLPVPGIERPIGEWLEVPKLGEAAGIGTTRLGTGGAAFADVVANVRELVPKPTLDLQARVPFASQAMESPEGDQYYFTVLEVRAEAAPTSIDQVRAQVVADVKRIDAFERLKGEIESYRTAAATQDLNALAANFRKPGTPIGTPAPLDIVERVTITASAADNAQLNAPEVSAAVSASLSKLGALFQPKPENASDRMVAVPLPKEFSVAILELVGQRPVVIEDLRKQTSRVAASLGAQELAEIQRKNDLPSALSMSVLSDAVGLELVDGPGKPASETESK